MDPAAALFGWGTERFSRMVDAMRDLLFREAASDPSIDGVIFTFVWGLDQGTPFRLALKPAQRDVDAARARQLEMNAKYRMNTGGTLPLDFPHLVVDTEAMDAVCAAGKIQQAFGLQRPPSVGGKLPNGALIEGPITGIEADAERVLRTLPAWFGVEEALRRYACDTNRLPTFVVRDQGRVTAFLSLARHFAQSWEVHCIAVEAASRKRGLGRLLHRHAEDWLLSQDARLLQVKTLAASHPSAEYAETRRFYERLEYLPMETFPALWGPHLPVLQLVKTLGGAR